MRSAKNLRREGRKLVTSARQRKVGQPGDAERIAGLERAVQDIVLVLNEHREALDVLLEEANDE